MDENAVQVRRLLQTILRSGRKIRRILPCGRVYRIDFDRFPYFRSCFISELYNVQPSAVGLHWPDADIDIEIEYIENPPAETSDVDLDWWKAQRKRILSRLGAIGGSVKSPSKAAASRRNGSKGGRPRKSAVPASA